MATDNLLKKIYYDLRHPAGFASAEKLFHYATESNPKITIEYVKEWLSEQLPYTLHKLARRNWKRNRIHVYSFNEQWQADLTFLAGYAKENKGFKYVLTVIDCFSKYAYAKPLKNKQTSSIIKTFAKIFKERKPVKLQTDKGTEFDNTKFRNFCKKNDVMYFTTNDLKIKCAIVERFNRTIKNKMFKVFTANGNKVWYNKLDDLVFGYNQSIHRSTKFKPIEVGFHNQHHVYKNLYADIEKDEKPQLKTGDTVRKAYDTTKEAFNRGYLPNWTDNIYTVKKTIQSSKPVYKIDDDKNKKRSFYKYELQKVKPNYHRVERVIRSRKHGNRKEVLVKWLNYPDTFNSWIPAKEIVSMEALQK